MKKIFVITLLILISGCAVHDRDWEGISEREQMRWQALNVDEDDAREYVRHGLTAMDVERWVDQGFMEQEEIIEWSKSQFNAYEATNWRKRGFSAEDARDWARENFSAMEADQWHQKGFSLEEAMRERAKGLEPDNNT